MEPFPDQHNAPAYTVSEISGRLKHVVEDAFGHVRVRGEISGCSRPKSGHLYFSLKDDKAVLDSVCWRGTAERFSFKPEDGLEVICTGRLTTYPGRSKYQIVIEYMEPAGAGALMALLEKRKAQLEAEGLFRPERKKPLPFLPEVIGVVTSPSGAVIRDILHRLADRFPRHVLLWPVLVQGEGAAAQIAAAIRGFNALPERGGAIPRPDILIVARGGGSLEDLWAFNEEIVVRAAADSAIPLISAVGHETDTTLIDYASDRRAPTPTAAAEMAVPVREEWRLTIAEHGARLDRGIRRRLTDSQLRVEGLARGLPRPQQLLDSAMQRLDDWSERLTAALPLLMTRKQERLMRLIAGLRVPQLQRDIRQAGQRVQDEALRLNAAYLRLLDRRSERLIHLAQLLESYHYQKILARGFALVRCESGQPVTSAAAAGQTARMTLEFHDGAVRVIPETSPPRHGGAKPKARKGHADVQTCLF